ncbi:MAG: cupin domain-containing protein [Gammaproteobacteria bacterium]|nr:cupin domain-containing protein [Gammaproteobacteria bacterium]
MSQRKQPEQGETIEQAVMEALLQGVAPVTPPPDLRAKVLERIRSQPPASEFLTLRQQQGWKSLALGIEVKLLVMDKEAGTKSFLLRASPGVSMPAHDHDCDEECLVLEGEFTIDGMTLRAGDYQLAAKGPGMASAPPPRVWWSICAPVFSIIRGYDSARNLVLLTHRAFAVRRAFRIS